MTRVFSVFSFLQVVVGLRRSHQYIDDSSGLQMGAIQASEPGMLIVDNVSIDSEGYLHAWLEPVAFGKFRQGVANYTDMPPLSSICSKQIPRTFLVGPDLVVVTICSNPCQGWNNEHPVETCFTSISLHAVDNVSSLPQMPFMLYQNSTVIFGGGRYTNFAEWQNEVLLPAFDTFEWYVENMGSQGETIDLALSPQNAPHLFDLSLLTGRPVLSHDAISANQCFRRIVFGLSDRLDMYRMWDRIQHEPGPAKYATDRLAQYQKVALQLSGYPWFAHDFAKREKKSPTALWMQRSGDRIVKNPSDVEDAFRNAGVQVSLIDAGHTPLKALLTALYDNDMIFGVHGADFANTIFLPPSTVRTTLLMQILNCGYPNVDKFSKIPHHLSAYALAKKHLYMQVALQDLQECKGLWHHSNFNIENLEGLVDFFRAGALYLRRFDAHARTAAQTTAEALQLELCGSAPVCNKIGFYSNDRS